MSKQYQVLKVKKIKSKSDLTLALQHNTRERVPYNAIPEKASKNIIRGSLESTLNLFDSKLPKKIRKNAVLAVEFIVSLSEEKANNMEGLDIGNYFGTAQNWIIKRLGGIENFIHMAVHRDERTDHMHIIMIPLVDKKLSYNSYLGGSKYALSKLQTDFNNEIGVHFGLDRGCEQSGVKNRSFHAYHEKLTRPTPELPQIKLPKITLATLTDQKAYAEKVQTIYQNAYSPIIESLALKRRDNEWKQETIEQVKKTSSERIKQIDELKKRMIEMQATFNKMILENGEDLIAYRNKLIQRKEQQKKRDQKYDNGIGY